MKYCSLDLELSGFDPLEDEILEIGLAFFEPEARGLRVTEKWSQVFRPKDTVHPKILGLTGITPEELDKAPALSDLHDLIQQKLDDTVIIGHNTVLDAKFLEAFGFHLSGQFIDTLDLVQFLLPTRHSYNLENLMHHFQVPHKEAHRALGDSLATVTLLEQLIRQYKSFPGDLQEQLYKLASRHKFLWLDLFAFLFAFEALAVESNSSSAPDPARLQRLPLIQPGKLTLQPFDDTTPETTARALLASSFGLTQPVLLVVADKLSVLKLWQDGLGQGIFSPRDRFNPEKFGQMIKRTDLTVEQTMFCLKILVWLRTNWQTETIIDLNLSFFGGQFRQLINDRPLEEEADAALVCCDYETFMALSEKRLYAKRVPVLWNAHRLEQWLREGSQGRLTWNQALYLLRTIYNPETDFGQQDLREPVLAALAAADLFFGLVNLMVSRHFGGQQYITYEKLASNEFVFNKIQTAAANFVLKVQVVAAAGTFAELEHFSTLLNDFFVETPEHIKWIETTETNCIFADRPLHIAPVLQKALAPYPAPAVTDNVPDRQLLDYILRRLGLEMIDLAVAEDYSNLSQPVGCSVIDGPGTGKAMEEAILELLQPAALPAAVLFPAKAEVRAFYDNHYSTLKQFSNILAQSYSGGSNKILRNFSIQAASILLATPPFVIRSARSLPARTVIIDGMPNVDSAHPYMKALHDYWQEDFPNFLQMQFLLKFYLLLQIFYSPALEHIYLFKGKDNNLDLENTPLLSLKKV